MKNILRSLGHNPSSSLHGLFGPQSAPGILKYMFECLIFVLMGWIWNVMWDNWFVIQFNLIASSDERKVGIYFGGTEQKPAFFFSRSISSHPSNKYNHGSNNCLLLFVFYLVRLKKTNRKKATVRPSETIKKHQQQGPAVVLLSIYLFCCYVCWLSVLVEYTGCPIKTVISQNIFLDKWNFHKCVTPHLLFTHIESLPSPCLLYK